MNFSQMAFETARSAGDKAGNRIQEQQQNSVIDQILNNAISTNDPQAMDNVMGQILKIQDPNLRKDAVNMVMTRSKQLQDQQKQAQMNQVDQNLGFPPDFYKASPQAQKAYAEQMLSRQKKRDDFEATIAKEEREFKRTLFKEKRAQDREIEKEEREDRRMTPQEKTKLSEITGALKTANQLKRIIETNEWALGPIAGRLNPSSSAIKARKKVEQMGVSLIKNIFRDQNMNKKEFEALMNVITSPTKLYSSNLGAAESIISILTNNRDAILGSNGDINDFNLEESGDTGITQEQVNEIFK